MTNIAVKQIWQDIHEKDAFFIKLWEDMSKNIS
jgi:hypothetical protein